MPSISKYVSIFSAMKAAIPGTQCVIKENISIDDNFSFGNNYREYKIRTQVIKETYQSTFFVYRRKVLCT